MRKRLLSLVAVVVSLNVGAAARASAQNPDSLVRLLSSSEWRVRSSAVRGLNALPIASLPSSFAPTATALLEREALHPDSAGEGYGEYLIALIRGVLRLRDPVSLRGMALLGIATSRDAQDFVAAQGGVALPYLDEAWSSPMRQSAVLETWASMLGAYRNKLTPSERLQVMGRVLSARVLLPLGFAWAADIASLPETVPLLLDIAATDSFDIVRRRATTILTRLGPARDALAPIALLQRLADWHDAVCQNASGARNGACTSLGNLLDDATKQVAAGRAPAALSVLSAFADRADNAAGQGALTETERRLFAENALYLIARLRAP